MSGKTRRESSESRQPPLLMRGEVTKSSTPPDTQSESASSPYKPPTVSDDITLSEPEFNRFVSYIGQELSKDAKKMAAGKKKSGIFSLMTPIQVEDFANPRIFNLFDVIFPLLKSANKETTERKRRRLTFLNLLATGGRSSYGRAVLRAIQLRLRSCGLSGHGAQFIARLTGLPSRRSTSRDTKAVAVAAMSQTTELLESVRKAGLQLVLLVDDLHFFSKDRTGLSVNIDTTTVVVVVTDADATLIAKKHDKMHPPSLRSIDSVETLVRTLSLEMSDTRSEGILANSFTYVATNNDSEARQLFGPARNVHYLASWPIQLKEHDNFFKVALELFKLFKKYLEKYCLLMVGDHPVFRFFQRLCRSLVLGNALPSSVTTQEEKQLSAFKRVCAVSGTFHHSLNSQQTVFELYRHIFDCVFQHVRDRKLSKTVKVHTMFYWCEVLNSAWLYERDIIMAVLKAKPQFAKRREVATLRWLLDYLIGTVVTIWHAFRGRNFALFLCAMKNWTLIANVLERRNYRYATITFFIYLDYWKTHCPALYQFYEQKYYMICDSLIERVHSIIRHASKGVDTGFEGICAAAMQSMSEFMNDFRTAYDDPPPARYSIRLRDIDVTRAREYLYLLFTLLVTNPDQSMVSGHCKKNEESRWILPNLHGDREVKQTRMPMGYAHQPPFVDLCEICRGNNKDTVVFICGHGYCNNDQCLPPVEVDANIQRLMCHVCRTWLSQELFKACTTADLMYSEWPSNSDEDVEEKDDEEEEDEEGNEEAPSIDAKASAKALTDARQRFAVSGSALPDIRKSASKPAKKRKDRNSNQQGQYGKDDFVR